MSSVRPKEFNQFTQELSQLPPATQERSRAGPGLFADQSLHKARMMTFRTLKSALTTITVGTLLCTLFPWHFENLELHSGQMYLGRSSGIRALLELEVWVFCKEKQFSRALVFICIFLAQCYLICTVLGLGMNSLYTANIQL